LVSLKLTNGNNANLDVTSSDFTNNPNLTCIEVDDEAYADANWDDIKDASASYSENCNSSLNTDNLFATTVSISPNPTTTSLTINVFETLKKVEI